MMTETRVPLDRKAEELFLSRGDYAPEELEIALYTIYTLDFMGKPENSHLKGEELRQAAMQYFVARMVELNERHPEMYDPRLLVPARA
ncbi:MAG: hypothetical protein QXU82_00055 [Candidatus Aenigmatarchaeota archaeon]